MASVYDWSINVVSKDEKFRWFHEHIASLAADGFGSKIFAKYCVKNKATPLFAVDDTATRPFLVYEVREASYIALLHKIVSYLDRLNISESRSPYSFEMRRQSNS